MITIHPYTLNISAAFEPQNIEYRMKNYVNVIPNFQFYINSFSSASEPTSYTLNEARAGKQMQSIVKNDALAEKLKAYNLPQKEFFVLKNELLEIRKLQMV